MPQRSPKQLYHKLFYSYTAIIVCIVGALTVYFISATKARILDTNLEYMRMTGEKAVSYLQECSDITGNIRNELYQSASILDDLLFYMREDDESYQRYRLDTYMASASLVYQGFDDFAEKSLETYPRMEQIDFLSYTKGELTSCLPEGRNIKNRVDAGEPGETGNGLAEEAGRISFVKEIRNPLTLRSEGYMRAVFEAEEFARIQEYYQRAELAVTGEDGTKIYASRDYDVRRLSEAAPNTYVNQNRIQGYTVYTFLDKRKASRIPFSVFITILGTGGLLLTAGEIFIHYYLKRLTRRLDYILEGMRRVTTGDLGIRLEADRNGDELDVISENFNEMCVKLDRYIQKSYLAEIEQKNAEMEVLQNQINPHFLYNTLEAVRMKAICNGDREVGRMLYSMAVIFRSQLKDDDVITVAREVYYCKQYLELFEYRYQGKFTSRVECPLELLNLPIIKFILQPVIENYFIHGIRQESEGNEIEVTVEDGGDALLIHVVDNGRGMEEEQMRLKNRELEQNRPDGKKSIGLMNVNRRLKAVYGEEYGLTLMHGKSGGMHVLLRLRRE